MPDFDLQPLPEATPFLFDSSNAKRLVNPNESPWIRSQDIVWTAFIMLFSLVGLAFAWHGASAWLELQVLEHGSEIQGHVLLIWEDGGTTNDDSYRVDTYVRYTYAVGGRSYSKVGYMPDGNAASLKAGSPITVLYAPSQPSLAMLPAVFEQKRNEAPLVPLGMGVGILWLMALMLRGMFRERERRRYREMYGRVLPGRLVSFTGKLDSDDDFMVNVAYEFASPNKHKCVGKRSGCLNDLKTKPLPVPGTPVWIFYVEEEDFELL